MANDILKEAIADAKAVREVALANAKAALEEAFTPQLQSMLSAKLSEELNEEEDLEENTEEIEENYYEDDPKADDVKEEVEEVEEATNLDEEIDLEEILNELELEEGEEAEETVEEATEEVEETIDEAEGDEEEFEVDESLFREGDDDDDDDDDDNETVEENNDVSSGIGTGDNKEPVSNAKTASTEDPGDSTEVKDLDGVSALKAENREYKSAVLFLKNKLHEVNILNAKLLFTNKLFKEFALNNNQKLKVVETFDRTQSTREIKLVYSTLAEQFGDNGTITRKSLKESASAKSGSTKPSKGSRKVISEETNVANRFKKLAGIL